MVTDKVYSTSPLYFHVLSHTCTPLVGVSAPSVQDATSRFHLPKWLEEPKTMSTTYSAFVVLYARDNSPPETSSTLWTIRNWSASVTTRLQKPEVRHLSTF